MGSKGIGDKYNTLYNKCSTAVVAYQMPADRPSGDVYLEVPPMSNWTYSDSDTAR